MARSSSGCVANAIRYVRPVLGIPESDSTGAAGFDTETTTETGPPGGSIQPRAKSAVYSASCAIFAALNSLLLTTKHKITHITRTNDLQSSVRGIKRWQYNKLKIADV